MSVPQEALDAAARRLAALFGGNSEPNPDEIKWASEILLDAAPLIRAAERERIAKLADQHGAHYDCGDLDYGEPFADLIREEAT